VCRARPPLSCAGSAAVVLVRGRYDALMEGGINKVGVNDEAVLSLR
jgi:hypothetical protein